MSDERIIQNQDNIVSVEAVERRSEYPVVDFDSYETICNFNNDSSRRRGILSEELYTEIVKDPSTGFINFDNSRIPVLMDLSHGMAMGYDTVRCQKNANELSPNIKILTLPFHELNDDERNQLAGLIQSYGKCALYFSDHNNDESIAMSETFNKTGIRHAEKPLVDSRAAKGDEQAALYLYSCCAEQKPERGKRKKLRLADVQDFYEKNAEPFYTSDGKAMTTLNMGDKISDKEAEEMWRIYDDMFNFLGGEEHPISMQDSKEDFYKLLRSNSTMIAATYKKLENGANELTCFTYFIDDMNNLYWLNQDFFKKNSDNNPDYITDVFTPGLVSKGIDRSYAPLSIGFFSRIADETGLSANVTFENTNLSKRYVPRIVDASMGRACKYTVVRPSSLIDKVTYRLWSISGEDV